jgi:hypothetical protein
MKLILPALLALASASVVVAQPTFSFGPSSSYIDGKTGFGGTDPRYESGHQAFNQAASTSAQTTGFRAYSESVSLTGPAAGRNVGGTPTSGNYQTYSGYSGPAVYGAYRLTTTANTAGFSNPFVNYNSTNATATSSSYFDTGLRNNLSTLGGNDAITVFSGAAGTAASAGSLTFNTSLLLTANLGGSFGFGATDTITATAVRGNATGFTGSARVVIKQNGQYYVSDFSKSIGTTSTAISFNATDLAGNWSLYAPLTTIDYSVSSSATLDLSSGVTWGGVLLNAAFDRTYSSGASAPGFYNLSASELTITATAIPEPSTAALAAGALGLGLALFSRRRRS